MTSSQCDMTWVILKTLLLRVISCLGNLEKSAFVQKKIDLLVSGQPIFVASRKSRGFKFLFVSPPFSSIFANFLPLFSAHSDDGINSQRQMWGDSKNGGILRVMCQHF